MSATVSHPRHGFDEHLNAPVRLSILSALVKVDEAEFQLVRDAVELTDSVLSRQVGVLEAAGYVRVRKGYVGKRPRTWLAATPTGRAALQRHLTALRSLVGEL
ncbi:MAG: winged helix-turn-helix domain-containing protein [Microbacteriaceae bacterium]